MLKKIIVKKIKGIEDKTFNININPNQLTIFVAPNGFGKSSIAHAFKSLNPGKILLNEEDYFLNDECNNQPELIIEDEKNTFTADNNKNEISGNYGVFVINSRLNAQAKGQRLESAFVSKAILETKPAVLIENVPNKENIDIKITNIKNGFGKNGKIFTKLEITKNQKFYSYINSAHLLTEDYRLIENIRTLVNSFEGNFEEIKIEIENSRNLIQLNEKLENLMNYCLINFDISFSKRIIYLLFVNELNKRYKNFPKFLKYQAFLEKSDQIKNNIDSFNSTREKINYKTKSKSLIAVYPDPSHISNGQRDILTFYTDLLLAHNKLIKNDKAILIIDEVFDYLDDANLIALQYFVSELIDDFHQQNKQLYPILLTHLDPNYFNHFVVSKKQIRYLDADKQDNRKLSTIEKLILKREDSLIEEDLSKYFLHYHPQIEEINIGEKLKSLSLPEEWGKPKIFIKKCFDEFYNYEKPENIFDGIKIAVATRIAIEKLAYIRLPTQELKQKFIETYKTKNKLDLCSLYGIPIPETFYLLSIIYNNTLHMRDNDSDIITPLHSKLSNPTIKKMILEIYNNYKKEMDNSQKVSS